MRKWFWSGIVAITAVAANVGAAGFALYEHGAAATATAGAFIARANDPSAIYYNPAGISGQRAGVMLGTTLITPSGDFTPKSVSRGPWPWCGSPTTSTGMANGHCGVDVFTLLKSEGGWRIATLVWSVEQPPACQRHPAGPPPGAAPN